MRVEIRVERLRKQFAVDALELFVGADVLQEVYFGTETDAHLLDFV